VVEARVPEQVGRWHQLLAASASIEEGRQLLREVLAAPLVFTPTPTGYGVHDHIECYAQYSGEVELGC
jgi:hypothetical protein